MTKANPVLSQISSRLPAFLQTPAAARTLRAVLFVLAMLVPIASLLYVPIFIEKPLDHFTPNYWNDEVGYWRYVDTFRVAGFESGYHVFEERIPTLRFSHFDVHGPFYPMFIGTIARFTGWTFVTPIYINVALISLAVGLCMWITRMSSLQIFMMMVLIASFWIIPLHSMGISQEPLHQAFAIVMGGIFGYLLQHRTLNKIQTALLMAVILYMAFIRVQWALVIFPLWLLRTPRITLWTVLQATLLTGVFASGGYLMFTLTASPGGSSITAAMEALRTNFFEGVGKLLETMRLNTEKVFAQLGMTILTSQLLLALGILSGIFVIARNTRSYLSALFHSYNLGLVLLLALLLYLPNGYARVWGVCLLISLIVIIVQKQYRLFATLFLITLFFFPAFVLEYNQWQGDFLFNPIVVQAEREKMATLVEVDLTLDAWCNTVLFDVALYNYRALLFPSEMGLAWYYPTEFPDLPIKSKYIYSQYEMPSELRLELIAEAPFGGSGNLYRNLDANCP